MNRKYIDNLYKDKTPIQLTPEEILTLTKAIAIIEHAKFPKINAVQEPEDTALEVLTYAYHKSAIGKKGIKELQANYTMKHFKNTLFVEVRNSICYSLRKNYIREFICEAESLDSEIGEDNKNTLKDIIKDERLTIAPQYKTELEAMFNSIDNTENDKIEIRYDDRPVCKFSYRNLMLLIYKVDKGTQIKPDTLRKNLYHSDTGIPLSRKEITNILNNFKQFILDNKILGGIV